eukprot:TRINITY_DN24825_c0_g1_i1.p1 TRINITY_DN24825_c0_g1~~TRINITY_DN24825_c0_g1_i1.p1  ORF type:complete len:685 (+),score=137.24 TRINITY_DN24825_c0_g1_i1:38-2092(+)
MPMPSMAWVFVAFLLVLLVSQNADLDFVQFACTRFSVQQFYDTLSFLLEPLGGADALSGCSEAATRQILHRCGVNGSEDLVLEIGFGTGRLARRLIDEVRVQRYDGVELSEGMLNITARRLEEMDSRRVGLYHSHDPLALLGSSEALRTYSHVLALFVFDSLAQVDIERALERLHRRVRSGGRLCVAVLADKPDRIAVKVYKALWRTFPLLFGGRRPLALRSLFDKHRWSLVDSWLIDEGPVMLPLEAFVLRRNDAKGDISAQADYGNLSAEVRDGRVAALERWATFVPEIPPPANSSDIRRVVVNSTDKLPLGIAKDVAGLWLAEMQEEKLREFLMQDIAASTRDTFLDDYERSLRAKPSVLVAFEMQRLIKSWNTASLESWLLPSTKHLDVEQLREHIFTSIDLALNTLKNDMEADLQGTDGLLRHRRAAASATTLEELREVNSRMEQETYVSPSEMSRTELEAALAKNIDAMPRIEIEDEIMAYYERLPLEELREMMRADVSKLTSEEFLGRCLEAVDTSNITLLRPLVREVAERLLSENDLQLLAWPSARRTEGPIGGTANFEHASYDWRIQKDELARGLLLDIYDAWEYPEAESSWDFEGEAPREERESLEDDYARSLGGRRVGDKTGDLGKGRYGNAWSKSSKAETKDRTRTARSVNEHDRHPHLAEQTLRRPKADEL